jgi:hypothetical protein
MAEINLVEAVNRALAHEMAHDPSVVLLGEDIGVNGGVFRATIGLQQRFGSELRRKTGRRQVVRDCDSDPVGNAAFVAYATKIGELRGYCPDRLTEILAITNSEAEIAALDEHWQRRTIVGMLSSPATPRLFLQADSAFSAILCRGHPAILEKSAAQCIARRNSFKSRNRLSRTKVQRLPSLCRT